MWAQKFHKKFPNVPFVKSEISKASGIPVSTLTKQYNKAVHGGHPPGTNPHQMAVSQVYKYVLIRTSEKPGKAKTSKKR